MFHVFSLSSCATTTITATATRAGLLLGATRVGLGGVWTADLPGIQVQNPAEVSRVAILYNFIPSKLNLHPVLNVFVCFLLLYSNNRRFTAIGAYSGSPRGIGYFRTLVLLQT